MWPVTHTITVECTNSNGTGSASTNYDVLLHVQIDGVSPASGTASAPANVAVTYTHNQGCGPIRILLDGSQAWASGNGAGTYTRTITISTGGTHTITVECTQFGLTASDSDTYVVAGASSAPTVTINSFNPASGTQSPPLDVAVTYTIDQNCTVKFFDDNTLVWMASRSAAAHTDTPYNALAEGNHTLKVECSNANGTGVDMASYTVGIKWTRPNDVLRYNAGSVCIGSQCYGSGLLSVSGLAAARDVIVTKVDWADYVFRADYPLMSLAELAAYIEQEGHLPGVPTQAQVLAEGVRVGAMQATLLEKVEELTLHLLDLAERKKTLTPSNRASLAELAAYIEEQGHLPGVPTQVQVQAEGMHVGAIQATLLEKVEQLTLRLTHVAGAPGASEPISISSGRGEESVERIPWSGSRASRSHSAGLPLATGPWQTRATTEPAPMPEDEFWKFDNGVLYYEGNVCISQADLDECGGHTLAVDGTVVVKEMLTQPEETLWITNGNGTDGLWAGNPLQYAGGPVVIGHNKTGSPNYLLAVDGNLAARELIVTLDGWPDFVFEDGYSLRPLAEVARHLKQYGHLPGSPSVEAVKAGGIGMGAMTALLLQKVEELTLYMIAHPRHLE